MGVLLLLLLLLLQWMRMSVPRKLAQNGMAAAALAVEGNECDGEDGSRWHTSKHVRCCCCGAYERMVGGWEGTQFERG
jgi:hypothetical protein